MKSERKVRPAGKCTHRPRPGAIEIEPGMWWDAVTYHLWVSSETWLDHRTHLLIGCLMVDFMVPGADLCEAIGRVALHDFLLTFPEAVPAGVNHVVCEICDHAEGGEVK